MADSKYQLIKEIFLQARELPLADRNPFVQKKAAGNPEVVNEVNALLAHDNAQTILEIDKPIQHRTLPIADPLGLQGPPKIKQAKNFRQIIFSSRGKSGLVLVAMAMLFASIGLLVAHKTKDHLKIMRAEELSAVRDGNLKALRYWLDDYLKVTQMEAANPALIDWAYSRLVATEDLKSPWEVDTLLKPLFEHGWAVSYIITDLAGNIVKARNPALEGMRVNPRFGEKIYRAAGGQWQFITPFYPDSIRQFKEPSKPMVWLQVPVLDASGKPIATFGLGRLAETDFTRIMQTAHIGISGETYAIDKDGYFLSESRFEKQLRAMNLLPKDSGVSSILNVKARTGSLANNDAVKPLTQLAIGVVAAQESGSPLTSGVLMQPSEDYMGRQVVGAWMWIPDLGFGIITQMDYAEAFASLRYLYLFIGLLVFIMLALAGYSFATAKQLLMVQGELSKALEMGQYSIDKLIAQGGQGSIYLAHHNLLKRKTAIKVMRLGADENAAQRFEREVKLASQLSHPNTIDVYDFGMSADSQAYCAMEYLAGLNLAEVVKRSGPMPVPRVIHVLKQTCASLYEAHQLGLVHRDIKPQNIMLLNNIGLPDFVKVLDFGLAKPFEQPQNENETRTISGTPVYISPERLNRPSLATPNEDIYAVGAVAYYLLAGQPMFSYHSDLDILFQILNEAPKPLPESVPEDIARLVFFCIEKDPENRPTDIGELKQFLDVLTEKYPWADEQAIAWWKKFGAG
jgi:tRNA A-37 threonylcarbamoyl transferase component Bud32